MAILFLRVANDINKRIIKPLMYYVFIVNIPEEVDPYTHPGTHFAKQKNPQFGAKAAAAERNSPERIQAFKNMALTPSNEPLFDEDLVGQKI